MKKIYRCGNSLELQTFKEGLKRNDIAFLVKNEYIAGAIGELPFTEAWPELWVIDDALFDKAKSVCMQLEKELLTPQPDWGCQNCGEQNDSSFEFCWQCEHLNMLTI